MPHVNIKYFRTDITEEQKRQINESVSQLLESIFSCSANVISIALEPIDPLGWHAEVYDSEILQRAHLLCKVPHY
jgi:phenylpyruvate tautomerase PptA (4-oxalocrotonate tautomerase family)